ncbi:TolB family protein [Mucilaginibacter ginsenosidivorans]|uniref:Uncharacterized protein n=1 Tax=Mucilaginibacter ginsenosidivorans TaxID=398053 RepID=A0A5B8V3X2_9SPHI|nr:PD40 domain-containing protein [Mucilaginibacter ginsenosidivorans]QEC65276.1 hypothetical protein FRZ54_22785 [Mucilaginibacter ginsenosidivorans]
MKVYPIIFPIFLLPILAHSTTNLTPILADTTAKAKPEVVMFAPGILPGTTNVVAAPAFSPDGRSVYLGQTEDRKSITIVASYFKNGAWTNPVVAPFSGTYANLEPAFAPNGKYLIFASSRPKTAGGSLLDGNWGGHAYPGHGGNLWRTNHNKKGWSEPERLPDIINQNGSVFSPAVAGDGSLYFMRADSGGYFTSTARN